MQNSFTLSKSAFIRDVQCHKSESQFSYDDININNSMAASMSYENLYYETNQTIIDKTKQDLLEYCGLDTLAMVEIRFLAY